ncbi:MAG: hypothetical protein HY276_10555 [Ignavibacteriales bacterium]|nr:hypothetical protein [Ignavibacteriales bacterium]
MNHQHTSPLRGEQLLSRFDSMGNFDKLENINLDGCRLKALPVNISNLNGLTQIRRTSDFWIFGQIN